MATDSGLTSLLEDMVRPVRDAADAVQGLVRDLGGQGGLGGGGPREAAGLQPVVAAMERNTARVNVMVAAMDRLNATMRTVGLLSGVSAAAGVARTFGVGGGRMPTMAAPSPRAMSAPLPPSASPPRPTPTPPPTPTPAATSKKSRPMTSDEAYEINRAKREAKRRAEIAKLPEEEQGPAIERMERAQRAADTRRANQKKKGAATPTPPPSLAPVPQSREEAAWEHAWSALDPNAPVPAPTTPTAAGSSAAGGDGKRAAGGAGGGIGGGGAPEIQALITALRNNTTATDRNTAAILKGGRGGRGGGGGGDADGGGLTLEGIARHKNFVGLLEDQQKALQKFGNVATQIATIGGSGILGMVSAISPSAISTLSDSFGMLSGEIGKSFVPYVYQAADGLQDLTKMFGGLDSGLKSGLARIVSYTVLGLGAMAAFAGFTALRIAAVTGIVRVFSSTLAIATANPIVLWLGLVAAGVVTLTGQWSNLLSVTKQATGAMVEGVGAGIRAVGDVGDGRPHGPKPEDLGILPQNLQAKIAGAKPAESVGLIGGHLAELEKELEAAKQAMAAPLAQELEATRKRQAILEERRASLDELLKSQNLRQEKYNQMSPRDPERKRLMMEDIQTADMRLNNERRLAQEKAEAAGVGLTDLGAKALGYTFDKNMMKISTLGELLPRHVPGGDKISNLEKMVTSVQSLMTAFGASGDGEHLRNWKAPFQSRYSDPSSFRDSVQLAALNTGDAAAVRAEQQMEQLYKEQQTSNAGILTALTNLEKAIKALPKEIYPFSR